MTGLHVSSHFRVSCQGMVRGDARIRVIPDVIRHGAGDMPEYGARVMSSRSPIIW